MASSRRSIRSIEDHLSIGLPVLFSELLVFRWTPRTGFPSVSEEFRSSFQRMQEIENMENELLVFFGSFENALDSLEEFLVRRNLFRFLDQYGNINDIVKNDVLRTPLSARCSQVPDYLEERIRNQQKWFKGNDDFSLTFAKEFLRRKFSVMRSSFKAPQPLSLLPPVAPPRRYRSGAKMPGSPPLQLLSTASHFISSGYTASGRPRRNSGFIGALSPPKTHRTTLFNTGQLPSPPPTPPQSQRSNIASHGTSLISSSDRLLRAAQAHQTSGLESYRRVFAGDRRIDEGLTIACHSYPPSPSPTPPRSGRLRRPSEKLPLACNELADSATDAQNANVLVEHNTESKLDVPHKRELMTDTVSMVENDDLAHSSDQTPENSEVSDLSNERLRQRSWKNSSKNLIVPVSEIVGNVCVNTTITSTDKAEGRASTQINGCDAKSILSNIEQNHVSLRDKAYDYYLLPERAQSFSLLDASLAAQFQRQHGAQSCPPRAEEAGIRWHEKTPDTINKLHSNSISCNFNKPQQATLHCFVKQDHDEGIAFNVSNKGNRPNMVREESLPGGSEPNVDLMNVNIDNDRLLQETAM